jgi:glycerol-3-phosphate O-acyltransferase
MRRSFKNDPLYKAAFYEYVQQLLGDGHSMEFFLEGTRARSGKMLSPKFGLLKVLTDAYFTKKTENLYFVPVSINYSRVLEGETFPLELLGESKVKESLSRIINAAKYIKMNFGSIYVEIGDPINFKTFSQKLIQKEGLSPSTNPKDEKLISSNLGLHLIHQLSLNLLIMPTAVCATILLMHRKGITEDELTIQVQFLLNILRKKKAKLPASCNTAKS